MPPRVLHIVENLNRGAVETWLVRMLRFAVERQVPLDWTFYCTLGEKGQLDEEARKLGAKIVYSPVPLNRTVEFMAALRRELKSGRYDVMHCHHDLVSAIYLLASLGLPIGKRIVHVHNADESLPTPSYWKARLLRPVLRGICLAMADNIVGISNHTLDTFLAGRKRRPGKDRVHYYGVDPAPFKNADNNRVAFRRELDLPGDCRVLLFAGRMVPEKNPIFALEVFAELHRSDSKTAAVFVGAGSLDAAVRQRARSLGIDGAVRQLGWRNDVAAVMSCCDVFILPRPEMPREGFGLAVVEAQLAGLRMLLSQGVLDDPLLPTAVYRRLALSAGARPWAEAAHDLLQKIGAPFCETLTAFEKSPFNLEFALRDLQALHSGATG